MAHKIGAVLKNRDFYLVALLAVVFGAIAGVLSTLFVRIMEALQDFIWNDLPGHVSIPKNIYIVLVCVIGGLLVGLAVHRFGERPVSIEHALENYKTTKQFDYKHIPQSFLIAILSLGFGAALGPEAGLVAIVGGVATWIGFQLKQVISASFSDYLSISSVVGLLLHSPVGASLVAVDEQKTKGLQKLWLTISGVITALVGWYVFKFGLSGNNYFDLGNITYNFEAIDLAWAILPAIGGVVAGLCLAITGDFFERVFKPLHKRRYISAPIGGLALGLLACISPLILFSGHEGIRDLVSDYTTYTALGLIALGLMKGVIASLCLATGWKGGQFFPSMFAGAAVGLGVTLFIPVLSPMLGLAVGLSGALGVLLKKPAAAIALSVFFFPLSLWPAVAVGAFIGASASKIASKRLSTF